MQMQKQLRQLKTMPVAEKHPRLQMKAAKKKSHRQQNSKNGRNSGHFHLQTY